MSVATPTYLILLASRLSGDKLSLVDLIFVGYILALITIETIGDQQQWNYQTAKYKYRETAKVPAGFDQKDLDLGFRTTGLFAYSRHPNFAAEQAVWVAMYQWACFETLSVWNWTFVGALSYLLLFQGSTRLTEGITSKKYPEYKTYQQKVGKFLPNIFGSGWDKHAQEEAKLQKKK